MAGEHADAAQGGAISVALGRAASAVAGFAKIGPVREPVRGAVNPARPCVTRPLNLYFSEERNVDRWVPLDRYARDWGRRLIFGRPRFSGQSRMFLNLCAGLDRIGVPFRVNDFGHARRHPEEVACILGKPNLLDRMKWRNPIVFGAAVYNHPLDRPDLLEQLPVKKVLVPGEWMRRMCEPWWGSAVTAWPVGIDTVRWQPADGKDTDILLYDKVLWQRASCERSLIAPIRNRLDRMGVSFREIRYGSYREADFLDALKRCRAMIFLCEHETQGIAYQQALSCGVPIFAWDRGGPWLDKSYYPHRVEFGPVSSVPYWDVRCGEKFAGMEDFAEGLDSFWSGVKNGRFSPRDYVLENLTLEQCARSYVDIVRSVGACS